MALATGTTTIEMMSPDGVHQPVTGCAISLEVADVWKLWKKFEKYPNVIHPLRKNSWGDTSFCIADPEGLKISFFTKH